MGLIVPEDFALASLANEAERRVVEAFRDGLSDSWLILPDVSIAGTPEMFQLDIVLIHPEFGVVDIEVKGHQATVSGGQWLHRGKPMTPQPPDQAMKSAYALRTLLRSEFPHLQHLHVHYGVALPNTTSISGNFGPDFKRDQVITDIDLADPTDALERLVFLRPTAQNFTAEDASAIVTLLRPDADFTFDPSARMRRARSRLDELCANQTATLEHLDVNRRVIALGAAGTGKTRLAMRWAHRVLGRGERVLLTCYNEPLADRMSTQAIDDEDLTVGPFLRLALAMDGMKPLEVPPDADHAWWTITAVGHLQAHWHFVTERFDTIVVDEAQDFSPAWLAMLDALLDADGARRTLLVADPSQKLYARGFAVPAVEDGWTQAQLVVNCRNAHQIGALLRRKLNGAPAPSVAPEAVDVCFVAVGRDSDSDPVDHNTIATTVQDEIDRLLREERDPNQIMVLTFSSKLRDNLANAVDLHRWEHRSRGIVGENVHRAKGLEADTVILVADQADVPKDLLYVGVSRAVSELVVIGPTGLGDRLGLSPVG